MDDKKRRMMLAVLIASQVDDEFNPATLTGVQAVWDASIANTLFQDSAGTTAAGIGDPVGLWNDRTGTYTATQATTADKPTRQSNYLSFDGTGDFLKSDYNPSSAIREVYVLCRTSITNNPRVIISQLGDVDNGFEFRIGNGSNYFVSYGANSIHAGVGSQVANTTQTLNLRADASNITLFVDNTSKGTTTNSLVGTLTNPMFIGSRGLGAADVSLFWPGRIPFVLIGNTTFTADERTQLHTYLTEKFGATFA